MSGISSKASATVTEKNIVAKIDLIWAIFDFLNVEFHSILINQRKNELLKENQRF